jgi:hypothetical protein
MNTDPWKWIESRGHCRSRRDAQRAASSRDRRAFYADELGSNFARTSSQTKGQDAEPTEANQSESVDEFAVGRSQALNLLGATNENRGMLSRTHKIPFRTN